MNSHESSVAEVASVTMYRATCGACRWEGESRARRRDAQEDATDHNRRTHGARCPHRWILVPPGDDHCTLCGAYR